MLDDFEQPADVGRQLLRRRLDAGHPEPDRDGTVMRIDYDLPPDGGFVILRKQVDLPLPANYSFTFRLRGESPRNNVEFKLVDPQGKDVWWRQSSTSRFRADWQTTRRKKRESSHAWGSRTRRDKKVGAIELAISAGNGGKGLSGSTTCASRSACRRASIGARRR